MTREVRTGSRDGAPTKIAIARRTYPVSQADLWDALTNPERIPRWFLPVSGELKVGGRYQLEGNAGGTIERCDPPESFFVTWEFGGQVSWVEVRLTALEDGGTARTRLEIEHIAHVGDDMWAQFGPGAVGIGWDSILLGLSQHLSGSPAVTPENSAAWVASGEGKRFMTLSGERWRDAHVASGADEAEARGMAERTIAAYTTPPTEEPPSEEPS
jgi:uncharacterized protein YndB with AHSA1/START domain